MEQTTCFYATLGVPRDASEQELRHAYYAKALQFHPDKNNSSAESHADFVCLMAAYEVLSNASTRAEYDRKIIELQDQDGMQQSCVRASKTESSCPLSVLQGFPKATVLLLLSTEPKTWNLLFKGLATKQLMLIGSRGGGGGGGGGTRSAYESLLFLLLCYQYLITML